MPLRASMRTEDLSSNWTVKRGIGSPSPSDMRQSTIWWPVNTRARTSNVFSARRSRAAMVALAVASTTKWWGESPSQICSMMSLNNWAWVAGRCWSMSVIEGLLEFAEDVVKFNADVAGVAGPALVAVAGVNEGVEQQDWRPGTVLRFPFGEGHLEGLGVVPHTSWSKILILASVSRMIRAASDTACRTDRR